MGGPLGGYVFARAQLRAMHRRRVLARWCDAVLQWFSL